MPTPNLALTPVAAAQSQKHVTVNESLARIDAATQLTVKDRTRTAPPDTPEDGARYLIAAGATDVWAGHDAEIAAWDEAALNWIFLAPLEGWQVWISAEQQALRFDGSAWQAESLTRLGINATADDYNRFVVASDGVLLTHNGGSLFTTLNKATPSDTASLLFQINYSARAEIGLTGGTNLHFRTSPDGSSFTDVMTFDSAMGRAAFPAPVLINGLSVSPELALNLLPDQGRFGGTAPTDLVTPEFVFPSYMRGFNGSSLEGHAQFINGNTSYGGSSGILDPEVDALLSVLRPPGRRRYGPEWWVMKVTKGTRTGSGATIGGVTRHPVLRMQHVPLPRAYTTGFYVRVLVGSGYTDQALTSRFARWGTDETGNLDAGVVAPDDGWVFIERQMTVNGSGFNADAIKLYLENEGDEALIALPRVVVGHVALDPVFPGPLPNARCFG